MATQHRRRFLRSPVVVFQTASILRPYYAVYDGRTGTLVHHDNGRPVLRQDGSYYLAKNEFCDSAHATYYTIRSTCSPDVYAFHPNRPLLDCDGKELPAYGNVAQVLPTASGLATLSRGADVHTVRLGVDRVYTFPREKDEDERDCAPNYIHTDGVNLALFWPDYCAVFSSDMKPGTTRSGTLDDFRYGLLCLKEAYGKQRVETLDGTVLASGYTKYCLLDGGSSYASYYAYEDADSPGLTVVNVNRRGVLTIFTVPFEVAAMEDTPHGLEFHSYWGFAPEHGATVLVTDDYGKVVSCMRECHYSKKLGRGLRCYVLRVGARIQAQVTGEEYVVPTKGNAVTTYNDHVFPPADALAGEVLTGLLVRDLIVLVAKYL